MEVSSNKTQWPWSTAGKALAAAVVLAIPAVCLSPINLRLNDLASPPPAAMVLPVTVAVDDAAAPALVIEAPSLALATASPTVERPEASAGLAATSMVSDAPGLAV